MVLRQASSHGPTGVVRQHPLAGGRVASRRLLTKKRCILATQLLPLPYGRVITSR
jgi:hypothetical protein